MDLSSPAHRAGTHDRDGARESRATGLKQRALNQAARELLLAQASDWPFILRTGTSPDYARKRVKDHLLRFIALHEQLTATSVDEPWLARLEATDNIFREVDYNIGCEPRKNQPQITQINTDGSLGGRAGAATLPKYFFSKNHDGRAPPP